MHHVRLHRLAAATFLVALGLASSAIAKAGYPDREYGSQGVSIQRGVGMQAVALLPSGRNLTVVGFSASTADGKGGSLVPGVLSVLRLGPHGGRLGGFGTVLKIPSLISANGAVREPGGRFVVATTVFPHDRFPCQTVLHGFDAHGHVDEQFGARGVARLSIGCEVRLLRGPTGAILAVGESTDSAVTTGVSLVRVSPGGQELGATVVTPPFDFSEGAVGAAVTEASGAVTAICTNSDGQAFLVRFAPDGSVERTFGHEGIRLVNLFRVQIDDAARDRQGRLLLAGSHLGETPGGTEPVDGMLARLSPDGSIDRSFENGGKANIPGQSELDAVRPDGRGRVLAVGLYGAVLRFTAAGKLDRGFGRGGTSVLPPAGRGGDSPLYRVSDLLITPGAAYVALSKYRVYRAAVEQVRLS